MIVKTWISSGKTMVITIPRPMIDGYNIGNGAIIEFPTFKILKEGTAWIPEQKFLKEELSTEVIKDDIIEEKAEPKKELPKPPVPPIQHKIDRKHEPINVKII